jgi:Tol biopolymer transport system component
VNDEGQFAIQSTFSKDGRQLAYGWSNGPRFELRIASLGNTGSQTRRLLFNEDVAVIFPDDWSTDGKWLAVQLRREDKTSQIGLVSLQDGKLHILKSIDWRGATKLLFSPDSRYVVYDPPVEDESNERDLFILSVDGTREIPVAAHPGNDVAMGWSPDGKCLFFSSVRSGTTGLWKIKFEDGKVAAMPEPVKAEISGAPLGVTRNGNLHLLVYHPSFNSRSTNIQTADFDFTKGEFTSKRADPAQTFLGSNNNPRWSPDGKYLAYVSNRPEMTGSFAGTFGAHVIVIRAVDTGKVVREIRPALGLYPATVSWASDGRSFFTQGTDLKGRQGIFRIDAQKGEVFPIAISPASHGELGSPRIRLMERSFTTSRRHLRAREMKSS